MTADPTFPDAMRTITDRGTCFQDAMFAAARFSQAGADPIICHGTPVGNGPDNTGIRYWHAWVEVRTDGGWICIDPKGNYRRADYYGVGQIVPRDHVWRFTPRQAVDAYDRYGHCGPWVSDYNTITPY